MTQSRSVVINNDLVLLAISVGIQLILGFFFGHIYDMRLFMATGYLVGTGQNPYIPQDLSSVFHNASFSNITTVGYPPPWPLVLGGIYLIVGRGIAWLPVYNLSIKIPIIAANIGLAFLVRKVAVRAGASDLAARRAWVVMLLNPYLLFVSAAWGQIDTIVALIVLASLVMLDEGKLIYSAVLLSLAISFKPTALPIIPVVFMYLLSRNVKPVLLYFSTMLATFFILCVLPFIVFGWDPSPILIGWNAFFVVGGGMSFMAFYELIANSYQIPGWWWLVGLLWVPAVGVVTSRLITGKINLIGLLRQSTVLLLVFFLTRAWLSEPNLVLLFPFVLILTLLGEFNQLVLTTIWVVPLVFGVFNTSLAQLFFPTMPDVMNAFLNYMEIFRTARLIAKPIVVLPWLAAGWWSVVHAMGRRSSVASSR